MSLITSPEHRATIVNHRTQATTTWLPTYREVNNQFRATIFDAADGRIIWQPASPHDTPQSAQSPS